MTARKDFPRDCYVHLTSLEEAGHRLFACRNPPRSNAVPCVTTFANSLLCLTRSPSSPAPPTVSAFRPAHLDRTSQGVLSTWKIEIRSWASQPSDSALGAGYWVPGATSPIRQPSPASPNAHRESQTAAVLRVGRSPGRDTSASATPLHRTARWPRSHS